MVPPPRWRCTPGAGVEYLPPLTPAAGWLHKCASVHLKFCEGPGLGAGGWPLPRGWWAWALVQRSPALTTGGVPSAHRGPPSH